MEHSKHSLIWDSTMKNVNLYNMMKVILGTFNLIIFYVLYWIIIIYNFCYSNTKDLCLNSKCIKTNIWYSFLHQEMLWILCGHVKCLLRWVFYGRWSVIDYTKQQVLASNLKVITLKIEFTNAKYFFYWAFAKSWPQYSYKTLSIRN